MSIRLDPRRVNTLKHLAGEAGVRPGDLVRQWVEERIDSQRGGEPGASVGGGSVLERVEDLAARVEALEAGRYDAGGPRPATVPAPPEPAESVEAAVQPEGSQQPEESEHSERQGAKRVSAKPSGERVALHDEMIAVIREQGPQTPSDLAAAIVGRGRYTVPRSGKPLDAKTVSQRVSNPTYRSRFLRREGRIGLAEEA